MKRPLRWLLALLPVAILLTVTGVFALQGWQRRAREHEQQREAARAEARPLFNAAMTLADSLQIAVRRVPAAQLTGPWYLDVVALPGQGFRLSWAEETAPGSYAVLAKSELRPEIFTLPSTRGLLLDGGPHAFNLVEVDGVRWRRVEVFREVQADGRDFALFISVAEPIADGDVDELP